MVRDGEEVLGAPHEHRVDHRVRVLGPAPEADAQPGAAVVGDVEPADPHSVAVGQIEVLDSRRVERGAAALGTQCREQRVVRLSRIAHADGHEHGHGTAVRQAEGRHHPFAVARDPVRLRPEVGDRGRHGLQNGGPVVVGQVVALRSLFLERGPEGLGRPRAPTH